ncbi:acyloxyacyl hydrolase [Marinilabiliaceae bacterium ANBcel2]|nr:acyloxyacyl hydrolase [Marinilabiliaceae bacterium ANBcel2]
MPNKNRAKSLLILLILFTAIKGLTAQKIDRFKGSVNYGAIISHADDLKPYSKNNPSGFTLSWQRKNLNIESFHTCNCFYYTGVEFSYFNFRDKDVLGSAYSLSGTFDPLIYKTGKLKLYLQSSVGVSYLTKIHNKEKNPDNNFFSSRISFLLSLGPSFEYKISQYFSGELSLNFNHISNGGVKQPNRGMNFTVAGVSVNYYPSRKSLPSHKPIMPPANGWLWTELGVTTNKTESDKNRRKPLLSLATGATKTLSLINGIGCGIEFITDYSIEQNRSFKDQTIIAPFISHHFLLGKFDFSQRFGYYMHKSKSTTNNFYQRYTLTYLLKEHVKIGFSLKAHKHNAANLDFRIGYNF